MECNEGVLFHMGPEQSPTLRRPDRAQSFSRKADAIPGTLTCNVSFGFGHGNGTLSMSTAIKLDMQKVLQDVEQATAAAQREDWTRAEQALMEAQDRIGRVLREIGLARASPQLNEPPSHLKGDRG